MDDAFFPWWLVLLLGLWALALTIWQNAFAHRELRFWSGLATLAYLGLFLMTVSAGPRGPILETSDETSSGVNYFAVACIAVSLLFAIWGLGRLSVSAKELCYLLFTLANAAFCASMHCMEMAIGLLIVAGITTWSLHRKGVIRSIHWSAPGLRSLFRLLPSAKETRTGDGLLVGAFNVLFTIALMGTLSYSLRMETSRPETGSGHSILPSRDYLKRMQGNSARSREKTSPLNLVFEQRSDLVVLLAVLVFLTLGAGLTESKWFPVKATTDDRSQADSGKEQGP